MKMKAIFAFLLLILSREILAFPTEGNAEKDMVAKGKISYAKSSADIPAKINVEEESTELTVEDVTAISDSTKVKTPDVTDISDSAKRKAVLDEHVTNAPESSLHGSSTESPVSQKPSNISEGTKRILDILKKREKEDGSNLHIKIIIGVVVVCILILASIFFGIKCRKKRESPLKTDPEESVPSLQKDQMQNENGNTALTQSSV
ncbi:uncharacterized protein LOC118200670 [Stegodyphus dumicola]|uniref:uncharacterized protein LOC118200670 n=1 Tax=Stegodyphus dumicola TaxID=202533 RepID=UPI0015B2F9F7|nr:uncharacterized protein LOC118200670 [Stegodyphus dumicola]